MLAIAFGIFASICFAAASLLAQRGLYIRGAPGLPWLRTPFSYWRFILRFTGTHRSLCGTISLLWRSGFSCPA